MKKYISLILMAVIGLTLFSGCYFVTSYPEHIANTLGPEIVKYINDNDAESLKKLYSEEVHNTSSCNLDEELQELFDFIDGNITSYYIRMGSESYSSENGKVVRNNFDVRINDAETDTGETYLIVLGYISVNDEHPDRVGMYVLSAFDSEDYNISVSAGILH